LTDEAEDMERNKDHGGRGVSSWKKSRTPLLFDGDCQEVIHTLYHFLDGELTVERRLEIQHHLDDCSPCLEAFDFEAELRILIARSCRDQVPDKLRRRIAEALVEASKGHPGNEEPRGMHSV
jgi:mycothiol system anti-sigma-R factor